VIFHSMGASKIYEPQANSSRHLANSIDIYSQRLGQLAAWRDRSDVVSDTTIISYYNSIHIYYFSLSTIA
jgi:uncharacterized membrane protein